MLSARYDASRVYTPESLQVRNTFEDRMMGGAVWQGKENTFSYQANRQTTENLSRSTVQRGTSHNLLWDQNAASQDNRLRFRSEYILNYSQDRFETPDSLPALRRIPVRKAWFTVDRTPQYSDLDSIEGFNDGNHSASPSRTILLGPENTFANIALDLGRNSDPGIVYVYTNRKALNGGIWSAYVSVSDFAGNEMEWTPLIGGVASSYDEGELRFVLAFRNSGARFLKLVFEGTPDTSRVEVTELEVFQGEGGGGSNRFESSYQIVSLNGSYLFSEKYDASADVGFRDEPLSPEGLKKKNDIYFTLSGNQRFNPMLTGTARLQNEHRNVGDDILYSEMRLASYTLRYLPLETASFTLSCTDSWGFIRSQEVQENLAFLSQFHGNPLPALAMSVEGGFSRNQQLQSD